MTRENDEFRNKTVEESKQIDLEDIICRGKNYFLCGFKPYEYGNEIYYNNMIAIAFAIIGRLYTSKNESGQSDYKRGVEYIASEAHVTKRHVKVLRKQFKAHFRKKAGYAFRIPYDMATIIAKMIDLLEAKKADPMLIEYLEQYKDTLYRDVLVKKQFIEIEIAAGKESASEKVKTTYGQLNNLVTKV